VAAVDLEEQRRWERQRESDIVFTEAEVVALRAKVAELEADLERIIAEREDFRRYIHELEDRLGIPRAGSPEAP
jgi:uncharacterized membrane protein